MTTGLQRCKTLVTPQQRPQAIAMAQSDGQPDGPIALTRGATKALCILHNDFASRWPPRRQFAWPRHALIGFPSAGARRKPKTFYCVNIAQCPAHAPFCHISRKSFPKKSKRMKSFWSKKFLGSCWCTMKRFYLAECHRSEPCQIFKARWPNG